MAAVCLVFGFALSASGLAQAAPNGTPVSFVTAARGIQSGVHQPGHAIARTVAEWRELWTRHAGPTGAPPAVDLSTEMVIAVFAGERPTSGYEIEIVHVLSTPEGLRVTYRERTPPPGALVRPVLTAPFHVIRLARSDVRIDVVREP